MKKFLAAIMIAMLSMGSVANADARVIERGSAATVRNQRLKDGDEVSLPQMELPSMTEEPAVEEPEEEPPFDWTEWADPTISRKKACRIIRSPTLKRNRRSRPRPNNRR